MTRSRLRLRVTRTIREVFRATAAATRGVRALVTKPKPKTLRDRIRARPQTSVGAYNSRRKKGCGHKNLVNASFVAARARLGDVRTLAIDSWTFGTSHALLAAGATPSNIVVVNSGIDGVPSTRVLCHDGALLGVKVVVCKFGAYVARDTAPFGAVFADYTGTFLGSDDPEACRPMRDLEALFRCRFSDCVDGGRVLLAFSVCMRDRRMAAQRASIVAWVARLAHSHRFVLEHSVLPVVYQYNGLMLYFQFTLERVATLTPAQTQFYECVQAVDTCAFPIETVN